MEEISSLDSFHTDAESTARPDSEPPKLDEETSQASGDKVAEIPHDDGEATKDTEGANHDEDFEQISEGSFEVDENSRATSALPPDEGSTQDNPPDEGSIQDNPPEESSIQDNPPDEGSTRDNAPEEEDGDLKQDDKQPEEADGKGGGESADFEEVDANVSAGGNAAAADESDMLGESDMTLPTNADGEGEADVGVDAEIETEAEAAAEADAKAETEVDAEVASADKSASAMDVDNEEDEETAVETAHTPGDVEMLSASNSPAAGDKEDSKINERDEEDGDGDGGGEDEAAVEQPDVSMDAVEAVEEDAEVEDNSGKDVVDDATDDAKKQKAGGEEDEGAAADEAPEREADAGEDDEVEQEDEPVENVQEPEESDVCLIPDDPETQVTEAEKEQAILARENAEKEDAEKEAEKEKEKEAEAATKEGEETEAQAGGDATVDAEAQAVEAGAEAADAGSGSSEEAPLADAADAPDPDEPLLEELQTTAGDTSVTPKIIIAWIVTAAHTCKQCGMEKSCGFRFKNPETSDFEYLCEQTCCDAVLTANPGKYFIRRKKFLIEELSIEPKDSSEAVKENDNEADKEHAAGEGAPEEGDITGTDKSADVADKEDRGNVGTDAEATVEPNTHHCLQCKESKVCKYFFRQDEEQFYVCNDDCYNLLNAEEPDKFKLKRHSIRVRNIGATLSSGNATPKSGSQRETGVLARTAAEAEAARLERNASFTRRCAECFNEVTLGDKNLLWETMDFCNEICLGKYQRTIGANCQTCHGEVPHPALGKYCVRFGFDIRQFCCASCLNEYKKGLKTCSCCQKDISSGTEGFLAPVGDKEQFKDFCSQACMRRYDSMCNPKKKLRNDICAVCNNDKPVRVEIMLDGKEHTFCSNPCFSAFKFVSNIVADQCGMCTKYFERKGNESFTIYTERRAKVFCSRICLNVYIIVNRRIVSCQWCKVKKYNFDMIYKQQDAQEILMCSLNCLTLYGVSINAFSRTVAKCDNCNNSATPQYHLTMSDASMRNFCTYQCVMQFQSQFARAPLTLEADAQSPQPASAAKPSAPFPTGLPKRVKLKVNQQQQQQGSLQLKLSGKNSGANKKSGPTMPVISTVSSLASGETETMIGNVTVRRGRGRGRKLESPPPPLQQAPQTAPSGRGRPRKNIDYARSPSPVSLSPPRTSNSAKRASSVQGTVQSNTVSTETKIIAVPPYPPAVRNVQTSCKPQTVTVGFQTQPSTATTATQTGKDYSNKVLIPVPVPIFLPQPMYMYSAPFPVPVPIPLPIPVPIFIPTTRNSSQGILKEIKKIQDKMPADPFEAELLMMAEMVAEEKRESDSDSDEEVKPDPAMVSMQYSNSVQPVEVGNNSYGEEVLQMALKMATGEYDQPTVDLESAMTANTITNPPPGMVGHDDSMSHMSAHHMQQQQPQQHHMLEAQRGGRGRKRGAIAAPVSPRNNRSPVKRPRLQEMDTAAQQTPQAVQPTEKPDANMCLKYTFGVNAWRQWVMTKNADIEKSSIRRRTFKTELLQMTADELNYSLCLFVKEVRKPNGTEYAPDTIYYLVLGIQQYLYENGRIDNIFTDPYYERFTDCLDEVARKFSVLYNDSQYIVTRVEEEHLWECKQLGAHSPHVLLSTLMFFNTKHFNLTTVEEHMQLSFSHIMKHWKRSAQNAKTPGTRNVLLRFYPPQAGLDANPRKKKVYEQQENEDNPLRCPVRLYEFYLSKCPESVKTRNDVFYLQPERSCVPDSPVWYSTQALSQEALQKMLHRVKMVKEINIALLTS